MSDKPFKCGHPGCNKSFDTQNGLTRHINRAHKPPKRWVLGKKDKE